MKVRELIELLSKEDQEAEVVTLTSGLVGVMRLEHSYGKIFTAVAIHLPGPLRFNLDHGGVLEIMP